jgi:hypothetical protein
LRQSRLVARDQFGFHPLDFLPESSGLAWQRDQKAGYRRRHVQSQIFH